MNSIKYFLVAVLVLVAYSLAFSQLPAEIDTTGSWYLAWNDEFDYEDSTLDHAWESQNGPSGHILCSRWRENARV